MPKFLTRTIAATLAAGVLTGASITGPGMLADGEQPTTLTAIAQTNPLAPQQADAAWYDFTVRERGTVCGYRETKSLGQGQYSHRVLRNLKTWTSSRWQCLVTDQRVTNRTPRPYLGMPGGAR